jgi:hypothetical protein
MRTVNQQLVLSFRCAQRTLQQVVKQIMVFFVYYSTMNITRRFKIIAPNRIRLLGFAGSAQPTYCFAQRRKDAEKRNI